ncbi:MAG: hypothetical protein WDZ51_09565 [Pirellulaceae bacterium]
MPRRNRFEQCLSALLAVGMVLGTTTFAHAEPASRLATYEQEAGDTHFALSVKLDPTSIPASKGSEVIFLMDTSASQSGIYRDDSLAALKAALSALPPTTKVLVMAGDLHAVSMQEGFSTPQDAKVAQGLAKLEKRTPLGATDLPAILREAVGKFSADQGMQRSIVYLGKGTSRANLLGTTEFEQTIAQMAASQVSLTSLAIGPERDVQTLATLANHTGGMVAIDSDEVAPEQFGVQLASAAVAPVVWPTSAKFSVNVAKSYPENFPPLRVDRDTIVVGTLADRADLSLELQGQVAGSKIDLNWTAQPEASSEDQAYLPRLVELASKDGGVGLPTVGSAGLRESARMLLAAAEDYARLGRQALASGDREGAAKLADAALRIDSGHTSANHLAQAAMRDEVETATSAQPAPPTAPRSDAVDAPLNLGPEAGRFLSDVELQRSRQEQAIEADVERRLRGARDEMAIDPVGVRDGLKLLLENIERAPDLDGDVRARLRNKITTAIREASSRTLTFEAERQASAVRLAQAQERRRLNDALIRNDEKAKSIIEMFNSLMIEQEYDAAFDAAREARDVNPNNIATHLAVEMAQVAGNYNQMMRLREDRYRAALETLYQVELAHIPFPDNPSVVYPDPEFWESIQYRKEKYGSIDLASTGRAEQEIFRQLDAETKLAFIDTPLEEVVSYLKQLHGIEIQIDTRALDDVGLTTDTPVTRNLEGITLRSALRLMLKELDLTYIVANEVLMITTPEEAESELITKVYPVADLVLPVAVQLGGGMMGGGMGGMGGGMGGMGGGMGGMGGGMGGMGGGMGGMGGGMGGGMFAVDDEKSVATTSPESTENPVEPSEANADQRQAPRAAADFRLEVAEGQTRMDAWRKVFASGEIIPPVSLRLEIRRAMNTKRYSEAIELIHLALRHGQPQPWMYEGLGLAMQLEHAPPEEIERALMSALDFTSGPDHMLYLATYMARIGMDDRALKLFQQVAKLEPLRPEPYAYGLNAAKRVNDLEGIKWACIGTLSQEWDESTSHVKSDAYRTAKATLDQLAKEKRMDEAKQFTAQLQEAMIRDAIVKVTWTGDADLDLVIEEPSGTVCSLHNPRTTSGGVMLGDSIASLETAGGEGTSEVYVVPKGFAGDYKVLIKRVWGDVTAGKVTIDIYTGYGTKGQTHRREQIDLGKGGSLVTFNVPDGRRMEDLKDHEVQVVAKAHADVGRAVLAQQLNTLSEGSLSAEEYVTAINRNYSGFLRNARNAVGYKPEITTLPEGTMMSAFAVVTADRRYVRVSSAPNFTSIGEVHTFNFVDGESDVEGNPGDGDDN